MYRLRAMLIPIVACGFLLGGCDPLTGEAKDAVRRQLKDPDSAQFSDVDRCGDSDIVKGKVNAKNSFGGYTGADEFYFADGAAELGVGGPIFDRCLGAIRAQTKAILDSLPPDAHKRAEEEPAQYDQAAKNMVN